MQKNSIIFICPDYHCSFFYRDELRKRGWKADIFVPYGYPKKLLYNEDGLIMMDELYKNGEVSHNKAIMNFLFHIIFNYKFHFYYSNPDTLLFNVDYGHYFKKFFKESFRNHLFLSKFFGCKIINNPSGCIEEETKENFSKLDNGNVCGNCGWGSDVCNDARNKGRFEMLKRYVDLFVGNGTLDSTQYKATHFKYKCIDLNLWRPELEVPQKYLLPATDNLRILHSFYNKDREHSGKNIKGSPFILDAIERLKKEGHKVEYMFINDVPSTDMRYYQIQADIVVEQLIYGWWGSTGVECMALGKPVVCYLRPSWKTNFFKTFPEYDELPIVEADTSSVYDVLKKLVTDKEYRAQIGKNSRFFAERHFDMTKNAGELSDLLLGL